MSYQASNTDEYPTFGLVHCRSLSFQAEETEAKLNQNNSAKDNSNVPAHEDSPHISSAMRGRSISLAAPGIGTKRNVSIAEGGTNQSPQSRVDSINSAKLLGITRHL